MCVCLCACVCVFESTIMDHVDEVICCFVLACIEDYELEVELVAEEEDHSVVASVRVDDTRVSILEYILVRHW